MTGEARIPKRAITVIVPTYRDWTALSRCLEALGSQSYPADLIEILVVNNAPEDRPPDDLPLPANGRILDEPKKGSYAARNAGLRVARGEIILFTDSDCVPEPTWCEAAVGYLEDHPAVQRMGGEIRLQSRDGPPTIADVYERAFAFPIERYVGRGWAPTANMGTWGHVFDSVGSFEEDFYSGGDGAWGNRAQAQGFAIGYCAEAIVSHPPRTLGGILRKRRRISGARLRREIGERGRLQAMGAYFPRALRRLLPPTAPIKHLLRLKSSPTHLRWGAYFFIYFLRIDNEIARARILFFDAEPEHR